MPIRVVWIVVVVLGRLFHRVLLLLVLVLSLKGLVKIIVLLGNSIVVARVEWLATLTEISCHLALTSVPIVGLLRLWE